MSTTTDIVEQAIAKQEAEEIEPGSTAQDEKGKQDDKAKDAGTDKSGASGDNKKSKDEEPARPKYDEHGMRIKEEDKGTEADKAAADKAAKDKEEAEQKYTAKDAVEVEKPDLPPPPETNGSVTLSQAEQKHIADNIGEPIVIHGFTGTGDDRKEVDIKAYSARDIPANFSFANDQQRLAAQNGFQSLENKASELLNGYRREQAAEVQADYDRRENLGIQADVTDLQTDGLVINGETYKFPLFSVRPGDRGFDDSPEGKQMGEVLNIMESENKKYADQYQQGRPWKHIGFTEAFRLYLGRNPQVAEDQKKNDDQNKEDEERKRTAENGNTNRGFSATGNIVRPTVKPGTTTKDILARIEAEDF